MAQAEPRGRESCQERIEELAFSDRQDVGGAMRGFPVTEQLGGYWYCQAKRPAGKMGCGSNSVITIFRQP